MQTVSYKCPNCGAPLTFSIDTQNWECHFCNSTFTPQQIEELDSNQENSQPEENWKPEAYQDDNSRVYTCPDCGGRVITDTNTVSTFCVYCHSPNVIVGALQGEYRPNRLIPFQINKEKALEQFNNLLRKKIFVPKEFHRILEQGELGGMYIPYWLYDLNFRSELTAQGKIIKQWSDAHYDYIKTDVYNVTREGFFPFRMIPADASVRLDDDLATSIEPYDFTKMVAFDNAYLSGFFAESFDVDAKEGFIPVAERASSSSEQLLHSTLTVYNSVTGEQYHHNYNLLNTEYVMFPVWLLSAKWKDKTYHYALNAQTGKVAGQLPIHKGKVAALFGVSFLAFSLILLLLMVFVF